MFKTSRRKIVASILAVLFLLLFGTICIIYFASYMQMAEENRELLRQYSSEYRLGEEQEKPPLQATPSQDSPPPSARQRRPPGGPPRLELSTFYSVAISKEGQVLKVDTADVSTLDEETLTELAFQLINDLKQEGVEQDLIYQITDKGDYILAAFLFKGEDIDKKVAVLSGGERARLAMAKLILKPYNLLALDEPTNHMDIRSKDILKQALKNYDGSIIIVSHDRDFLDGLVDKLYEFRDGKVTEHLGGVADFLRKRKIETLNELERKAETAKENRADNAASEKPAATASRIEYRKQKFISKEERRMKNRIDFLERKIEEAESKMKEIEGVLAAPGPSDDIMELTREYLELKRDADTMTREWEELVEKVQ